MKMLYLDEIPTLNMATNDQCYCRQNGGIHLILGPMFSGKTTELFRLCTRQNLAGKKVGVVKYLRDTRYDENMASTHDCKKMEATAAEKIGDIFETLLKYDVIGIDEGQFFSDIVEYAEILANHGKLVFIAALDGNFAREPFECISKLLAFAEYACKLTAICHACGKPAPFTYRKTDDDQVEVIGGEDIYMAACRECHQDLSKKKKGASASSRSIPEVPQLSPSERENCEPIIPKRQKIVTTYMQ